MGDHVEIMGGFHVTAPPLHRVGPADFHFIRNAGILHDVQVVTSYTLPSDGRVLPLHAQRQSVHPLQSFLAEPSAIGRSVADKRSVSWFA